MIILVAFMLKCVSTNWLRQIAAYYRRLLSEMCRARCSKTQFMCLAPGQWLQFTRRAVRVRCYPGNNVTLWPGNPLLAITLDTRVMDLWWASDTVTMNLSMGHGLYTYCCHGDYDEMSLQLLYLQNLNLSYNTLSFLSRCSVDLSNSAECEHQEGVGGKVETQDEASH